MKTFMLTKQCAIMPDPGLKIGFQETTLENW